MSETTSKRNGPSDDDGDDGDLGDDARLVYGYCMLCRRKEVELYGTVVGGVPAIKGRVAKHHEACRLAGCKHPRFYPIP
jgi:hypothetical protein